MEVLPRSARWAVAAASILASSASSAVTLHSGPDWTLKAGGNFQFDLARVDLKTSSADETNGWRRQRLSLSAEIGKNLELSAEYDFTAQEFSDALIKLKGVGPGQLLIGQFKQPFLLDELTSDKRSLFVEAALPDNFALARRLGVGYLWNPGAFGLQGSFFGRNLNGIESTNGAALRGWWTPRQTADSVWHLGLAASRETVIAPSLSFSVRPETRYTPLRAARTPTLNDVDDVLRTGVELLVLEGSWYGQAEWLQTRNERSNNDTFTGSGWYAQAGYSFGARRGYKAGIVQAVDHGMSFELGARIASVDLNDGGVRGGQALSQGLVATWYVQPETRVMANLLHVNRSAQANAVNNGDFDVFEIRLQYVF